MIHIVRPDETLRRISARYYGDWTLWPIIADANRMDRREPPVPGRAIVVPMPRTSATEHTVADGDSYESLSLLYYGSEHFSEVIRSANDRKIIYESAGLRFTIPALADPERIAAMGVL
jgi:nucleoid-associated protein YgaU